MLSVKNIAVFSFALAWFWLPEYSALAQGLEPSKVDIAMTDVDGSALKLPGFWFLVPTTTESKSDSKPAPAVVLLHGCGGAYNAKGSLQVRMLDYARLLNSAGYSALVVDSLTPRGERELCTQGYGTRRVTMRNRRLDALAALEWLAARSDVDPKRLALLGWSNGGSTVLATTNTKNSPTNASISASKIKPQATPRAAVAFYPGCQSDLAGGYAATTPVLMLVGAIDDWTPPEPCKALADITPSLRLQTFPDAYHGFDGTAAVRLRADVPNGVNPGKGVHVGGNAAAREASQKAMLAFFAEQLQ